MKRYEKIGEKRDFLLGNILEICELEKGELATEVYLSEDDVLALIEGCLSYGGGHEGKDLEIYHHGIRTVLDAMQNAIKNPSLQSNMLLNMGKQELYRKAKKIVDNPNLMWAEKYDLIFSKDMSQKLDFFWNDPEANSNSILLVATDYQGCVMAWMKGFDEYMERNST